MDRIIASGEVLKVYQTGDRPILVLCADGYHYICKYKQPGYSANRLVNELIGSGFAKEWKRATPYNALIINDPIIWDNKGITHDLEAPLWGSRKMESVFDLSDINCSQIKPSFRSLYELLTIALFDMWMANEDRTCNNYNLLYDMKQGRIVSIDYGGIFNSGITNNPLYQLNAQDSIISSNLYDSLKKADAERVSNSIRLSFLKKVHNCQRISGRLLDCVPSEWSIDVPVYESKLSELFDMNWVNEVWDNFKSILRGE
jgi:hypothetical protein